MLSSPRTSRTRPEITLHSTAGQFRSDLFFRLRVVEIEIPSLRARGEEDIRDVIRMLRLNYDRAIERHGLPAAEAIR